MKNIILIFLLAVSSTLAQGIPTDFTIGSFWDPAMVDGNPSNINQTKLQRLFDANFNLLTGMNNGNNFPFDPQRNARGLTDEIVYKLRMVAQFNTNKGYTALKVAIQDAIWIDPISTHLSSNVNAIPTMNRFGPSAIIRPSGSNNPTPTYSLTVNGGLASDINASEMSSIRNALFGYSLGDEPCPDNDTNIPNDLSTTLNWMNALSTSDNSKIFYSNLNPIYGPGVKPSEPQSHCSAAFANHAAYESYLDQYFNSPFTRVATFDFYPFPAVGMFNDYFYNLNEFAKRTDAINMGNTKKMVFWAHPLSTNENGFAPITQSNLSFMVYSPITYGAKGLIYFTYALPNQAAYTAALLDANDNPCDASNINCASPIYTWVKDINLKVKNMSSIIMSLIHLSTVHGSGINPDNNETVPVIDANTPVLLSISGNNSTGNGTANLEVGIFKNIYSTQNYLMILNKDRTNINIANIVVQGNNMPIQHLGTIDSWTQTNFSYPSFNSTSFSSSLAPGEAKMILLSDATIESSILQQILLN